MEYQSIRHGKFEQFASEMSPTQVEKSRLPGRGGTGIARSVDVQDPLGYLHINQQRLWHAIKRQVLNITLKIFKTQL